jgi:type IV secretion system protein VirB9
MSRNALRHVHAIAGRALALLASIALSLPNARAEILPAKGTVDTRIREVAYNSQQVYRLTGFVGYQIDLQFEPGETFIGLGAGDIEGLSFVAQDNHLFLKPKAASVGTNLTVLTTRRHYQFDYTASNHRPNASEQEVIYALKFTYAPPVRASGPSAAERIESQLDEAAAQRTRNVDYWYCGRPGLKPLAASDDGVHTRLRFAARAELPAIFVRNEDGSESLLNFSMDAGDVIIHRVAHQYVLRRGKLTGCIVNQGFLASGERLESGTIAPTVERTTHRGQQ